VNLFILDYDIQRSATYHMDRHVVKMISEQLQILCTVHALSKNKIALPVKATHHHHPVMIWAANSLDNYLYVLDATKALCKEYTHRYGRPGKYTHAYEAHLPWAENNLPPIPSKGLTPWALCMPDEYKVSDPVQSYRSYYQGAKQELAAWKNRSVPAWFKVKDNNLPGDISTGFVSAKEKEQVALIQNQLRRTILRKRS
jgi:hypothetical protein